MVTALVYLDATDAGGLLGALQGSGSLFEDVDGFNGLTVKRGVEDPNRILITADWDSVEHHLAWQRDNREAFLGVLGPFISGQPEITHFE